MSKKELTEEDLKNKSLEELILLKDEEHDFLSINIPIIVSCLGIIASVDLTLNPQIWEQYPRAPICVWGMLIIFIILLSLTLRAISKKHKKVKKNLRIYDKVILKKLKELRKSDEEFKNRVINSLEEIQKKLN